VSGEHGELWDLGQDKVHIFLALQILHVLQSVFRPTAKGLLSSQGTVARSRDKMHRANS
jgi:hypothetical protein